MSATASTHLFNVPPFLESEDAVWPMPAPSDPVLRDPDLAQVEKAWRTGRLQTSNEI
jgi:hypothetical protein